MSNYTILHCHSMHSNAFTTMDSVTSYKDYILRAKECGMNAIAFTEHGNILEWLHKKEFCEKNDIKYIHGVEAYVTTTLDEKIRDNLHCVLLAKNYDGVLELNNLLSHLIACNRNDNHVYYQPRITYDELKNTSDNIIITTACLGGILYKENPVKDDFIKFLSDNKHRCYLELQHHMDNEQVEYNKYLLDLHLKHNIPLIIGTDTHALNEEHAEGRKILQKSKNIFFEDEDNWDIIFKTYEELIDSYTKQNSIPINFIYDALENTNKVAESIQEFEVDRSYKYPKLYENSEEIMKQKINDGVKKRGIKKVHDPKIVNERVIYEFETMKKLDNIDYFLLEDDVKRYARENGIQYGYSRGSVSGSLICYLLEITDVDSLKYDMNFERFLSPMRQSLADCDTDYPPNRRDDVKQYLYNRHGLYCSEIVTFNTIALKGAIRDVCRAFQIPLDEVSEITENVESDEQFYRDKYPEIFKYVDMLQGVIVSVGTHPSATIVSPHPLEDKIGTFTTSTCKYPISQINMKEVDSLNYVKLDLLGLDNIELISEACKLANIPMLTPDNMDFQDWNVYEEMVKSGLGVFQWESNTAHRYLKQLFNDKTIQNIKSVNPNLQYIDLLSTGNGAIRPAGNSYRDALATGIYHDNGHKSLNDLLSPTLGYLVYQEQILQFLNKFCGYTMAEADLVRRGFAKKTGTEQFIPKIKSGFIETMMGEYNTSRDDAEKIIEQFLVVIQDASSYLFSKNHSDPYSMIGFACAYLRHYYTLEFMTVYMNINKSDQDKLFNAMKYINTFTKIKVVQPKFRFARGVCTCNKEKDEIYKGTSVIKGINDNVADGLYTLKDNKYESFTELLYDIAINSIANKSQIETLIKLNYFSEFGSVSKLLTVFERFHDNKLYSKSTAKKESLPFDEDLIRKYSQKESEKQFSKVDFISVIKEWESSLPIFEDKIKDLVKYQIEYFGSVDLTYGEDRRRTVVTSIKKTEYNTQLDLYCLATGETKKFKLRKKNYRQEFKIGDILYIKDFEESHKLTPTKDENGEIIRDKNGKPKSYDKLDETELVLLSYIVEDEE